MLNVMLGLLLFCNLWRFYLCFKGLGWLVWLFKIAEHVCLILIFKFFLNTTPKKKKKTNDLFKPIKFKSAMPYF